MSADADYVLVGGGLQNGLIAMALLARDEATSLILIERDETLGGNHTWSFHDGYIPDDARAWVEPLVEHRWPRYRVRFPNAQRVIEHGYATISSGHFHAVVSARLSAAPNARLMLGGDVSEIHADRVVLTSGLAITARLVVDARGPTQALPSDSGFQKFVGLEVRLNRPIDATTADLMDATVPQLDGFRFAYVLPFASDRALIEDTYFSDDPKLDVDQVRARVLAYAEARGLSVASVIREESGVLPMPWRSMGELSTGPPLVAGFRGGWFHPATGYSLPVALRLARHIASQTPDGAFGPDYRRLAADQARQVRFGQLLNELLFTAAKPSQRWRVFEHFYTLPDDLVLRFYGLEMSRADRLRFFFRRPPKGVSFTKAMKILPAWAWR